MSMSAELWTVRKAIECLPESCRYHGTDFGRLGYEGPHGEPRCESCRPAWRRAAGLAAVQRMCDALAPRPTGGNHPRMNTPPDELTIMTEMLAVLADCNKLGGLDTDAGMDALTSGARRLAGRGRSAHFLLVLALSGWLGAVEGISAQGGISRAEVIARYASALSRADDEERREGSA